MYHIMVKRSALLCDLDLYASVTNVNNVHQTIDALGTTIDFYAYCQSAEFSLDWNWSNEFFRIVFPTGSK